MTMNKADVVEEIARRRGFFWISSEIYGGLSGFYDYGHLGTLMKRKFENIWREYFLSLNDNFYEIDTSNIMPENVFVASGHKEHFSDPMVKCKKCGNAERADQLVEEELKESFEGLSKEDLTKLIKKHNIKCPKCKGPLEEVDTLNMMFPLTVGENTTAYLRPETAQGVYVNFKREFEALRKKLPLGLAIVGKAFRNEISPRNLLIRMREFTQAELQIFFDPDKINQHEKFEEIKNYKLRLFPVTNRGKDKVDEITCLELSKKLPKFYIYYLAKIQEFYLEFLKLPRKKFRFKELSDEEKAFYNKIHWDIQLELNSGWTEIGGLHMRGSHDLTGHQKVSKKGMSININNREFIPNVLELSFGVDRNVFGMLDIAYTEEKERLVMRLPKRIAPIHVGVFPIVNRDGLEESAIDIQKLLKAHGFIVFYDDSGSIGRRYRRMDESGTPYCITIDYTSLTQKDVTIRERDSMNQIRVKIENLPFVLKKLIESETDLEDVRTLI